VVVVVLVVVPESGLVQASFRSIAAAISEAEGVLKIMDGTHRKLGWYTKPNTKSFVLAITAFCKTRHYYLYGGGPCRSDIETND
jgi:hypothetical protein